MVDFNFYINPIKPQENLNYNPEGFAPIRRYRQEDYFSGNFIHELMLEIIELNIPTKTNMSLTELLDLPPTMLESIMKSVKLLHAKENNDVDNLADEVRKNGLGKQKK